ncbi:MAG: DUF4160 domain-containing protein [Tannerella sp.]|jgi:hypothetical protein|nr:DUF4160 domain-containing protein [Tannerella sp.]
MPEIFEYLNLVFSFYSNEHEPIHVHVKSSERETVFDLIIKERVLTEIKKRDRQGKKSLTNKEEKMAKEFIEQYSSKIVEKWVNFFVLGTRVRKTVVRELIKKKIEIPVKLKEKSK